MNKFDERYDIRLADTSDIDDIMLFLDQYWRKGHIMSRDRELFQYEYADGDRINFVLAIDRKTKQMEGIFGFLNCSQTEDAGKKDIWGSMWKVNDQHDNLPFLGVELAKRVLTLTGCRTQIGNGANPNTTIPLRRLFFGDKAVRMRQYYLLNPSVKDYKIAIIKDKGNPVVFAAENQISLREFHSMEELKKHFDVEKIQAIPYKDNWYVNKRYFCHPYYKYLVYGLEDHKGKIGAIMVGRVLTCNGARVFRIVDYIGDQQLFARLSKAMKQLMTVYNLEYMDFYTFGFSEESILSAGFRLRTDDDPNIIPNYFEPFLRDNVDIWAHYKLDGTTFFKADGDQDRPNIYVENKNRKGD